MATDVAHANVIRARYKTLRPATSFQGEEIILARHAETIAEVFPDWIERCKLDGAYYQPFDLNVPVRLPKRMNMIEAYQCDPPVSEVGRIMAQLFARELVSRNAIPKTIFCSPTLASLQTATDIQNYIGKECGPTCIDASLASDRSSAQHWLGEKELSKLKFHINNSYSPIEVEVNDNGLKSIAEGMVKVIPKLSDAQGIVLVITDSMAVKMLRDLSTNYDPGDRTEKDLRGSAAHGYPAMSSIVLNVRQSRNGKKRIYPSRLFMRPLTSIGECTQTDFDIDNYRAKT
ncbi:unnamed protein product [Cylicocyclus nassatus]|uniref:Uncharacterized protein n=1 Tax=Cylicocyclus nassatus TaxID=53992 RepID=A0AA36GDC0_CYLNA|nr:unnamed protein product [Cylicocyclus nassatus]